jgi:N-acetylglucosaminyldiphosphoundecaprenol N-acetyl-beta-D-mannosaminyltransferase
VRIAGSAAPRISIERGPAEQKLAGQIRASGARLILVALGAPKQELWIHRWRGELGGAVCVAVGASLDFLAGRVRRAPGWISRAGLEWLFRLVQEPRRLARRYLVRDPRYALILVRTLLRG